MGNCFVLFCVTWWFVAQLTANSQLEMKVIDAQQAQSSLHREREEKLRISSELEAAVNTIHELKQQLQQVIYFDHTVNNNYYRNSIIFQL